LQAYFGGKVKHYLNNYFAQGVGPQLQTYLLRCSGKQHDRWGKHVSLRTTPLFCWKYCVQLLKKGNTRALTEFKRGV